MWCSLEGKPKESLMLLAIAENVVGRVVIYWEKSNGGLYIQTKKDSDEHCSHKKNPDFVDMYEEAKKTGLVSLLDSSGIFNSLGVSCGS